METSTEPICFDCDRPLSASRLCQLGLCAQRVTAQEVEEALRAPLT